VGGGGVAVAVVDGDAQGARRRGGVVDVAVVVHQVVQQCFDCGRRGRGRVESDHQIVAAAAAGEGADGDATVGDGAAADADLPGAGALVADRQQVFSGDAVGGDRHPHAAAVVVGRIAVRHRGIAAQVDQPGAVALGEGDAVALQAAQHGGRIGHVAGVE